MIHSYSAVYEDVRIRPLQKEDIENLRVWRNDNSQTSFLRNIPHITKKMQEEWYEDYLQDDSIMMFAIDETKELNRMVGSLALYNFDGVMAEIGKIQVGDAAAHGKGIGSKSFVLAMYLGFHKLNLKEIIAYVHRENIPAYKSYMRIGFEVIGNREASVGGIEDKISMSVERLTRVNSYIKEINLLK